MLIQKEEAQRIENSPECIVHNYPIGDKDINVALIEISGRYPEKGFVLNESVKEILFVMEGNGRVVMEKKDYALLEGDLFYIPPNKKYYIDGNFKLLVSCSPAWHPEQHKRL